MGKNAVFTLVALVSVLLLGTGAEAAIIELWCTQGGEPMPADRWSFHHESQVLTLTDSVYEVGPQPYDIAKERIIWIDGWMDSKSTFTVFENITNETGVPLRGYEINIGSTIVTYNVVVEGSVQATGSPEVIGRGPFIGLAWPEPIPDGEVFTVRFDIFCDEYNFGRLATDLRGTAIPEPATITLLGLGGLAMLRTRRLVRSRRKAQERE